MRATLQQLLDQAWEHQQAGRLAEAESLYRQALQSKADIPEVQNNLANLLAKRGAWDEAIQSYQTALKLKPGFPAAWLNLGIALRRSGRLREAISAYLQAIVVEPGLAAAYYNLGDALQMQGDLDQAIAAYRRSLELGPGHFDSLHNLGVALLAKGRTDEAIALFREVLERKPDSVEARNNLGNALLKKERVDEAIEQFRQAISLQPNLAAAEHNLGNALLARGEVGAAIAAYLRAISIQGDFAPAHFSLGMAQLLAGDFANGWREYEWRWKVKEIRLPPRDFAQPMWDGSDLNGRRIVLHAEQGFGDAIQFVRYVPLVARRNGKIVLECLPQQARLFQSLEGLEKIIARGQVLGDFDLHCPLLSLPLVLGLKESDGLFAPGPYLGAEASLRNKFADVLRVAGEKLKVGLVWLGRPDPPGRSIPSEMLKRLAMPEVQFFSLQMENANLPTEMNLIDATDRIGDFADTAGLMAGLDLIISIDTAAAQLAGAMGKKTWVLLKFAPDWRWMLGRSDSPWYPAMRLFRQPRMGDWETPLAQIGAELRLLAQQRNS